MRVRRNDQGHVRMPEPEFVAILARAAEEGAKRALADVGLEYRSPEHNRAVGGATRSKHMAGAAFAIAMLEVGMKGRETGMPTLPDRAAQQAVDAIEFVETGAPDCNWGELTSSQIALGFDRGPHASDPH